MHFTVNEQNKVSGFHIEKWDRGGLGEKTIKKIEKFKGKNYKDFLLFALKEKLFLKTVILYAMFSDRTVSFWGCPASQGEGLKKSTEESIRAFGLQKNSRFGEIHLYAVKDRFFYIAEKNLADVYEKMDIKFEKIDLDMSESKKTRLAASSIASEFWISRNMRNFTIAGKGTSKNRKLAHIPIEGPLFLGIKKDHTFQPLYGADAWELNSKTMGDYSGVFPLATNNKKEEKWRKKILKKFEKLNEKRKKELLKKVKKMKK